MANAVNAFGKKGGEETERYALAQTSVTGDGATSSAIPPDSNVAICHMLRTALLALYVGVSRGTTKLAQRPIEQIIAFTWTI